LTVIDTDSRTLAPADAGEKVRQFVQDLRGQSVDVVYKKTDSVMRGPVLAEVEALMFAFGRTTALLVPQNPSRGRTVRAGQYTVNDVPLYATSFSSDPQHPARTADVLELLGTSQQYTTSCLDPGHELPAGGGIVIGAAAEVQDIGYWAGRVTRSILPAGGADFFQATLQRHGCSPSRPLVKELAGRVTLFVCGSASAYAHELATRAQKEGVTVRAMPDDVFRESTEADARAAIEHWADSIGKALEASSRALVAIHRPLARKSDAPQRLQSAMAEVVARVLEQQRVENLLAAGGATASALCERMNWHQFEVNGELASGVVQMRVMAPGSQRLIIKPGSYAWPELVWRRGK
jgi:uncharacterized protein YgbK (DUF1537 family)